MKRLILIAFLLISTSCFAQDKIEKKSEAVTQQSNPSMVSIAANPQMRLEMMQMMIENTIDNPEEMQLLVDKIMSNPEMKNMISKVQDAAKTNDAANMPKMMNKYNSPMKTTETQNKPVIKK